MSHDIVAIGEQLHANGYRVTPQRQLILDAICELGGHVTPDAVYERVQRITQALNRSTVYRTLEFLSEQRILTVTQSVDGRTHYELAGAEPHHHLVCRTCQHAFEVPHTDLHFFFQHIQKEYKFVIDMDHLSFFGQCAECGRAGISRGE